MAKTQNPKKQVKHVPRKSTNQTRTQSTQISVLRNPSIQNSSQKSENQRVKPELTKTWIIEKYSKLANQGRHLKPKTYRQESRKPKNPTHKIKNTASKSNQTPQITTKQQSNQQSSKSNQILIQVTKASTQNPEITNTNKPSTQPHAHQIK